MNVIDTLRKLIAHQKSAEEIGSEAEAAAFAEKVQELLIKHQLEAADIVNEDTPDEVEAEYFFPERYGLPRRRSAWFERLGAVVARAHFCDVAIWAGSGRSAVTVFGKKTDREIATFMIVYLSRVARSLCERELQAALRRNPRTRRPAFRNSFLLGFVEAIHIRYFLLRRHSRQALETHALVVLDRTEKDVADFVNQRTKPTTALGRPGGHSTAGAALGRFHGSRVSLKPNALTTTATDNSRRLIGAGSSDES